MTVLKAQYGSSGQAISVTLASLASNTSVASAYVDNTTNLYDDAWLYFKFGFDSAPSAGGFVNVAAYGTVDNGSHWSYEEYGVDGTDTALTIVNVNNLGGSASVYSYANEADGTVTELSVVMPLSYLFAYGYTGSGIPEKWGIVFLNATDQPLSATEGNSLKMYQGVYAQVA